MAIARKNAAPDPRFFLLLILLFSSGMYLSGQTMQVTKAGTAPFTAENLISNVFLGSGVEVTGISYSGQERSVGYFTDGLQAVGLQRGIVLSNGLSETENPGLGEFGCHETGSVFASNIVSGFIPGSDPDLGPLVSGGLYDITRYTITFVPTADTLRFRYCFASEEYPEFSCSQYNDIFGFFIQGPNYPTPTNIALIPGANLPVSINNIHPDNSQAGPPCPAKNLQYYIGNANSNKQPTYDGLTAVFTAEAVVVPCETYTIKLVIADVGDPNYDSGVFLEAKSFGTGALRTELTTPSLDGTVTEGCAAATLRFQLPAPATGDYAIDYTILGTALNGLDYQFIPPDLVIPAGEQEITIPIIALEDGVAENGEYLAIDVRRDPCTRDTLRIVLRDNTMAPPDQLLDTSLCLGATQVVLNGTLPVSVPTPPSFTNDQDFTIHPVNATVSASVNVFGVLPPALQPGMIRSVCLNISHNWVDDLDVYLVSPGGQFLELMTDCGADGKNFTNTCFTPAATRSIAQATKSDAPYTGDWQPEGPWSDLWGGGLYPSNGIWTLQVRDDENGFIGTLQDWTITFEPLYGIHYQWSPANGLSCTDCPAPEASPNATTTYTLLATDSYGCTLEASATVSVLPALPAPVVSCNGFTNSTISFTWPDVPGATAYLVNANGTGWVNANGTNSHLVDNLGPNTLVTLEVQGVGAGTALCPAQIGAATCLNCNTPAVQVAASDARCAGAADGTVTLTPDGLNPPYTFGLAGQTNTTGIFTNLSAGNYTATVTDNAGCQALTPVVISAPLPIVLELNPAHVRCFNGSDGAASAAVQGGTGPYGYTWSSGEKTSGIVNKQAGLYTLTVTDAAGCTDAATVAIDAPAAPLDIQLSAAADTLCFAAANGAATAVVSGGTPPYLYNWTGTGQNSATVTGLGARVYTVLITDANACTATDSIELFQQEQLLATIISIEHPRCFDSADGRIIALAQGGASPYTYTWPPSVSTATDSLAANLPAGNYGVTASDARGCTGTAAVALVAPAPLLLDFESAPALCNGDSTGSARAVPEGGTPAYSFAWSTGAQQAEIQRVPAGNYQLTLTDRNGCSTSGTVAISQPASPLGGTAAKTDIGCSGDFTGTIQLHPTGGAPPYRFALNDAPWNGSSKQIGLGAGTYLPRIQDKNGCIAELSPVQLVNREPVRIDLGPPITINYGENAQLVASVANAQGAVEYAWNPADSPWLSCLNCPDPEVQNLEFDRWFVLTVSDSLGCTAEGRVLVSVLKTRKVFVPTAFSPNGDGANDRLLAHGQHDTQVILFQVFDRWGEMVYEGGGFQLNDADNGWDGTLRGQAVNSGVYVWVLEVEYADGVRDTFRGSTTLIR